MLISTLLVIMIRWTHILITQAKLFVSTQEEDLLENQNTNKKHHLEEGKLKKEGSAILTLTVCTRSYLSIITESQMQHITISLDVKESDCTIEAGTRH